jgi:hypothetical protein
MGVLEIFHNHEINIALLCQAITKIQDKTELWDNKKHKLIFAFKGKLSPDEIISTAYTKINEYLDKEEHLPSEPESEEALKPEKDAVDEQEANEKAKSPKQDNLTAKHAKKDKVASKTGAKKEKQRTKKAPKTEKPTT